MAPGGFLELPENINKILKKVSRTLYLSINIMPGSIKGVMGLGYLICRAADTVADSPEIEAEEKKRILALFAKLGDSVSHASLVDETRRFAGSVKHAGDKALLLSLAEILSLYGRLDGAVKSYTDKIVRGVVSGMLMDAEYFSDPSRVNAFEDAETLEKYCYLIGGAPGEFWADLYNFHLKRTKKGDLSVSDARDIGAALQITNILKDISVDLRMGRCYLPEKELGDAGVAPSQLLHKENLEKIRTLLGKWIVWGVDRLDNSEKFLAAIPKSELSLRAAVIWPVFWAMDTLMEVACGNPLDFSKRPKIKRKVIYSTIFSSGPLLLSNTSFSRGYRFRRETLIVKLSSGEKLSGGLK